MPVDVLSAIGFVGLAIVAGVGIDVDHFLVSRLQTGDWRALKRCLRTPSLLIVNQAAVFEEGELTALQRLLSHQLLGGIFVIIGWSTHAFVGWLLLAVLYVHILADLVGDVQKEMTPHHNR